MSVKRCLFLSAVIFLAAAQAFSLEWDAWDFDLGFTFQYNGEIGTGTNRKQPSKFMFNPGASLFFDWNGEDGGLYFRPGGWFSWNTEDLEQGIARPCDEAEADHMKVLGLMIDVPFGYGFKAGKTVIGVQCGPSFYCRFPLWTAQNGTAEPSDFWKAYYAGAEFLYLGLASWAAFPISETMDAMVGLKFYQPLSPMWTEAPFLHGFQASLIASLRFQVNREKTQEDK